MNQLKNSNIFEDEDDGELETPSVSDLIEFLQQFPENMSVLASWEGQRMPIYNAFMCTDINNKPILVINVDSAQCD